jgi:hypothetical protein
MTAEWVEDIKSKSGEALSLDRAGDQCESLGFDPDKENTEFHSVFTKKVGESVYSVTYELGSGVYVVTKGTPQGSTKSEFRTLVEVNEFIA